MTEPHWHQPIRLTPKRMDLFTGPELIALELWCIDHEIPWADLFQLEVPALERPEIRVSVYLRDDNGQRFTVCEHGTNYSHGPTPPGEQPCYRDVASTTYRVPVRICPPIPRCLWPVLRS